MARLRLVLLSVSLVLAGSVYVGYLHLAKVQDLSTGDLLERVSERHQIHDEGRAVSDAALAEEVQATQDVHLISETPLSQLIDRMFLIHMVSVLCFAAICISHVVSVERQMNSRIHRLSAAVESFAKDENATTLDFAGNDDLGWMAQAIETFRSNAEELRRSNRELEKFAYVAAHDLRSPLRAIQDLAEWTLEDRENRLSNDSRENMALLQKRVDRLNLLLSDLLTYSRVGRESHDIASVTLPQVVNATTEMLDPNGHFDVGYVGTTQEIVTHVTPLRLVLMNLISNSIKHHDRARGSIRVTATIVNDRLYVSVQDDGPGIEPQYHDRIFGLFQTLRPRDEVEGSGLGLAIIRKLVEHYGGSVLLISDPAIARGAKFEIDLPIMTEEVDEHIIAA